MIIAGSESRAVTQAVDGDGVVGSAKSDSTGVTGESTLGDVVRCLGANKEPVTTEDGIGSKCWSLK